jgi:hypothetical protein
VLLARVGFWLYTLKIDKVGTNTAAYSSAAKEKKVL